MSKSSVQMSAIVRSLYRLIAFLGGYFAKPCSLCNQEFYGFEWRSCSTVPHPYETRFSKMLCPRCSSGKVTLGDENPGPLRRLRLRFSSRNSPSIPG